MKDIQTKITNNVDKDTIDIVTILKKIWHKRILIQKGVIFFFIIGFLVAILSPVKYTSQTSFVPQISDNSATTNATGKLSSLASLAGIDLNPNAETSDSYLSPLVYEKIIDSEEFSLKLLDEELINSNSDKFTIREYLLSKESLFNFNPISFIKKYTIGLIFKKEPVKVKNDILKKYNFISDKDYYLLNSFRKKFSIQLNQKEGYIKVLATDQNPFISSQLVELITRSLQFKIIEIRTNKIKERLEFSKNNMN